MELILHLKKMHPLSNVINNFFKGAPKTVCLNRQRLVHLSIFLGHGGLRATNAEEVLEVEGWALWWQRPQ